MSRLARLSLVTTALTFLLSSVGGLVRATDSGLGCPGWPKCYGRWIPPADHHAIIEMTHRYLASGVSIGVIATCVIAVLFHRRDRTALALGLAIVPLVFGQALLGAYVVGRELEPWTVVAHLGLAMAFAATLIALTVHLTVPRSGTADGRTRALLGAAAAAVYGQLLLGSWVTGQHAGLAFPDWPLHNGQVVPNFDGRETAVLQFTHRIWAYCVVALLAVAAVRASRVFAKGTVARRLAHTAAGLGALQIVIGALNVYSDLHSAVVTTHLAVATFIWGSAFGAWASARRTAVAAVAVPETEDEPARLPFKEKAAAYLALTKPRIIELLLVTTLPTMVVAERGVPSGWLVLATLVGGSLAAGGANTLNMYIDRDIDRLMKRTSGRPLVTGAVTPRAAFVFALVLEVVAFTQLWLTVNLLSAVLAVSATLFYVFVYSLWLKRTSTSNIVIGGAAGAVPVLVGWSAVTGTLGLAPLVLFAIIFVWTPPHFWALAIRYREDYAAADVPMLPAVASIATTAQRILVYTLALWATSLLFASVGDMGVVYTASAVALGAVFVGLVVQLMRDNTSQRAMRVFGYSITYVTLLFGAMALDQLVRVPKP